MLVIEREIMRAKQNGKVVASATTIKQGKQEANVAEKEHSWPVNS
jgi:hypothetical protein